MELGAELGPEFLFSIYQNVDSRNGQSFNYQKVRRPKYYPQELRYLSERVEQETNPVEVDKLVSQFNNFIQNRKNDLLQMESLSQMREKVNLRKIYVLVDQHHQLVMNTSNNIIFLAGPLGGDILQLNEELNRVEKKKYYELIQFDVKNVGLPIKVTEFDLEFNHFKLCCDEKGQIHPDTFPIELPDYHISIIRAVKYFQDEYQKLSMINDFSPIIDSSLKAVYASILANNRYFLSLPEVVRQKFDQYNLDESTSYPNLLGIQKLMKISNNQPFNIEGFSFFENGKEYSIKIIDLSDGLSMFVLAEGNFAQVESLVREVKSSKELNYQINTFKNHSNRSSTLELKNLIAYNPVLEEVIGSKALKKKLQGTQTVRKIETVPIGYVRIIDDFDGENHCYFQTSFTKSQLHPVYSRIVVDLMGSLDVILSGTLDTLSFTTDNVSVFLKSGERYFKLELRKIDSDTRDLVVHLAGASFTDIIKDITDVGLFWKQEMIQYSVGMQDPENYTQLINLFPISQSFSRDEFIQFKSDFPLTTFTEYILKNHVVTVLLKRILKEVMEHERAHYGNSEATNQLNGTKESTNQVRINHNLLDDETSAQKQLNRLENEINQFNTGMYSFLTNMLRRENRINADDPLILYQIVNQIFQNMTMALIDFGLTPVQWKSADNLQLWSSYQAQINYMKHSIVLELREFLGNNFEGEGLEILANHKFTERMNYETYHGSIISGEYNNLRKIHLSFIPLIRKYRDQLQDATSLSDLIGILEKLEEKRKMMVRSQLPGLPKLMSNE